MLNEKYKTNEFKKAKWYIEIGDNVFIGSKNLILYNVKIGNNVIIGAGSIVTKNIPDNVIVAGVSAKTIGNFDDFANKRKQI